MDANVRLEADVGLDTFFFLFFCLVTMSTGFQKIVHYSKIWYVKQRTLSYLFNYLVADTGSFKSV